MGADSWPSDRRGAIGRPGNRDLAQSLCLFLLLMWMVCSGGGERGVRQARPDSVVGMEHQRRSLHRRRHGRHKNRQQPQLQPGHQVRVLRPEQHRLPRHKAVSRQLRAHVLPLRTAGVRQMSCRRFRCLYRAFGYAMRPPRCASTLLPLYLKSAS